MNGKILAISILLFVDLILVLIPAIMTAVRRKKLREYSLTAEAVVTEMTHTHMGGSVGDNTDSSRMWVPTFRYTVNGREYTQQSRVGTTKKLYEVGDRLKIKVDPNDNSKYILPESYGFRLATMILWIMAGCFTAGTVLAAVLLTRFK